jgi:hypothetical protein
MPTITALTAWVLKPSSRGAFLDYRQALGRCASEPLGSQPSVSAIPTAASRRRRLATDRGMGSARLAARPSLSERRPTPNRSISNRFALPLGLEGPAFYVPRTKMGRPAHDNSGRNQESANHREEMEPGARDVPEAAAIPGTGTRLRPSRVARMAPMRREPFRGRRAKCERGWGLALRFSRDLEPFSWGAESASQEPRRCCRKGFT